MLGSHLCTAVGAGGSWVLLGMGGVWGLSAHTGCSWKLWMPHPREFSSQVGWGFEKSGIMEPEVLELYDL